MKNLKIISFVLLAFCFITKAHSQEGVSLHFGPAMPVSDFAADDILDEDDGGAAVGLNVGLKYVYPLTENGLGLFGGIDINYNGLQRGYKDDVEDFYKELGVRNPDITFFKYINIPLTVGLNYTFLADEKVSLFANGGLALNFLKITDMEIEANGAKVTTEIDMASNLGVKIGGGIILNQKTSIAINYYALGKHDMEGKMKSGGLSEKFEGEAKVDIVTLTVGFKL